jgi:diguanylate cyclase (GGDEF)-like protein
MLARFEKTVYIICAVIYVIFGVIITNYATNMLSKREFLVFGNRAKELAMLTARAYRITDAEVDEIKQLKFKDLLQHPANLRLAELFAHDSGFDEIKYVYVMVKLDETQIKYHVTEKNEEFFGAKKDTPLDLLWLADLVVHQTPEELLKEDITYYDDIKRYSIFRPESEEAYQDRIPVYSMADYEYGKLICGWAPFYSVEGTYIGLLGVDLFIEQYEDVVRETKILLSIFFAIPTVLLTAAYLTMHIRNKRHIYSKAYTDSLTLIKNRRFIEEYFPSIVIEHYKKKLPLSVIMIDVDFFKLYNDHYGHQQGDEALKKISQAIQSVLRERTDFICRYGGEEILVILTNTNQAGAVMVANRIKRAVEALNIKHEHSACSDVATVSQGIYSAIPKSANYAKNLIMHADQGLYEAKHNGRNQFFANND